MTFEYVPYLALWLFVGGLVIISHVLNAALVLIDRRKPKTPSRQARGPQLRFRSYRPNRWSYPKRLLKQLR